MLAVYAQEASLMKRCAAGDASAFEALVQPYLATLALYLHQHVDDQDDTDELFQDILHKTFEYLRQHPDSVKAFFPWWKTLIKNASIDYWRQKRRATIVALDETRLAEIADTTPSPDKQVIEHEDRDASQTLWDFLLKQLREVFLASTSRQTVPGDGLLRLLAFLLYYRDGQTGPIVHHLITAHAERLGVSPPSEVTLNNWLARGRLLQRVLQHLLEAHPDYLKAAISTAVDRLPLTRIEHHFAMAYWCEGWDLEAISATSKFTQEEYRELFDVWATLGDSCQTQSDLFIYEADTPERPYRLVPDGCALLYHIVTAKLQEELLRMTKATLHTARKI